MILTEQQRTLLCMAVLKPDLILATAADSPNDIVWMEMVEQDVLEIVEHTDPEWLKIANRLDLRGYRATKRALEVGKRLHPITYDDMRTGGTA